MKRIDLSHTVHEGLVTYKGLPPPLICDYLSREASEGHYAEGVTFQIGKIEMVANTGTYVDSPFHRYADGKDLAGLDLNVLAEVDGLIVRPGRACRVIEPSWFLGLPVAGKAVLIHTDWSRHWNTEQYYQDHPFLTKAAAEYLRDHGAVIVGIDSYNIDDVNDGARPVHSVLLGADIPIVEHMCNLQQVPDGPFRFSAVPPKVQGFGTFAVRAYASVEQ